MHYTELSAEFSTKFFELIAGAKNIVITGHMSPDPDAISSVLALYEIITQKQPNKNVRMIISNDPVDDYKDFKNFDRIEFVPDIATELALDDTLIVADGSQLYRFSRQPEKLAQVKTRICIDHHASPIDDFTLSLAAPQYPACAEVIHRALCKDMAINKELAETFLLGILSDTGNFAYLKPGKTETLTLAKELLDVAQIQIQDLQLRYEKIRKHSFEVFKELTKNTVFATAPGWPNFQYSFVTEEFVKTGNYTEAELAQASGLYKDAYVRKVQDYPWGFVIKPSTNNETSVSARSLPGGVNVRALMEGAGLGGGHDRAAGGATKNSTVEQTIKLILDWIANNKPILS